MCYQNSVADRAMESDRGGGPYVPGTNHTTVKERISQLPNDMLKQAVVDTQRLINSSHAELACLVSELDARELPEIDDSLTTTQWLRQFCRMTIRDASGTVKTARALDHMPTVATACLEGEIPYESLRLLARARDRHPEAFVSKEREFANAAAHLDVQSLRSTVGRWDEEVDYDKAVDDVKSDARHRELFFNQMGGGRWDLYGRFGVADGHVINTALMGHMQRTAFDDPDNRSYYERLADSHVAIHRFWLDHNDQAPTSGGEKPHITVTIDYDVLTGDKRQLPHLDGYAVDPETVRTWACDAGIVRIVRDGDATPIDVGRRTRTIPPALRRALEHRDKGCAWPGCGAPIGWCDAHHVVHWAHGGPTSLDNCELLCGRHHTATHKGWRRPAEP